MRHGGLRGSVHEMLFEKMSDVYLGVYAGASDLVHSTLLGVIITGPIEGAVGPAHDAIVLAVQDAVGAPSA